MVMNHSTIIGAEELADLVGAAALDEEETEQEHARDWHHVLLERGRFARRGPSTAESTLMAGVIMPSP